MKCVSGLVMIVALGVWPAGASAVDKVGSAAPSPKEARRILRAPRGSLSLGKTNHGSLKNPVDLPLKGRGYAFFSMVEARGTHFMTAEMAGLIKRAAAQVARRYPGSVLGIGNVANAEGGRVGESVSHQNGRDADLGMFARDRRGRRVNLHGFVSFRKDGWDRGHRHRFDSHRTLALVTALITDPKAQVQWLFVAAWLRDRILRAAWSEGTDPAVIARLEEVLKQPGDSNPHAEHVHLRIFCSVQDRLYGCLERGPIWDWIDLGDARFERRVAEVSRLLDMPQARWRIRGMETLAALRAERAVPVLVKAAEDPDKGVRRAATGALWAIRSETSLAPLKALLPRVTDPVVAVKIGQVVARIGTPEAVALLEELLTHPERRLSPRLAPKARARLAKIALFQLGRRTEARLAAVILPSLQSPARGVRRAAHRALLELTTQRLKPAQWAGFVARSARRGDDWLTWARRGLTARGFALSKRLNWSDLPVLIGHLRDHDDISTYNASKALALITGFDPDPRDRTKRNNQRLWRSFVRQLGEFTAPEPESRAPRRRTTRTVSAVDGGRR